MIFKHRWKYTKKFEPASHLVRISQHVVTRLQNLSISLRCLFKKFLKSDFCLHLFHERSLLDGSKCHQSLISFENVFQVTEIYICGDVGTAWFDQRIMQLMIFETLRKKLAFWNNRHTLQFVNVRGKCLPYLLGIHNQQSNQIHRDFQVSQQCAWQSDLIREKSPLDSVFLLVLL